MTAQDFEKLILAIEKHGLQRYQAEELALEVGDVLPPAGEDGMIDVIVRGAKHKLPVSIWTGEALPSDLEPVAASAADSSEVKDLITRMEEATESGIIDADSIGAMLAAAWIKGAKEGE